ncbi:MAG: azu 1 [Fibrobacteres bacterium]|nr:azu 1 [Fibrobacterota bacterium]
MNISKNPGILSLRNALLPVLMGGLLLAACNKKEETKSEPPQAAAPAAAAIEITANDQMQFSTKTLEVPAGKETVIIMKNVGTMAKEAMGHNLTILNPGTDLPGYATKAMAAKDTDYQPASEAASVVTHTRLLGPGESDTLKVTLPAGEYPYLCTFPGHFAVMQGVLTAK